MPPVVPREPYSWLWVCLCSMRRYATSLWFNSLSYRLLLFKKNKKKTHIKKMMLGKVTLSWMCTARSCSSLPSCTCLHLWKIFFFHFHGKRKAGFALSIEQRLSALHRAQTSPAAARWQRCPERCNPASQHLRCPELEHAGRCWGQREVLCHPPAAGQCWGNATTDTDTGIDGSTFIHRTNHGQSPEFKNVTSDCLLLPRIWDKDIATL